jgi:hypothetical protein
VVWEVLKDPGLLRPAQLDFVSSNRTGRALRARSAADASEPLRQDFGIARVRRPKSRPPPQIDLVPDQYRTSVLLDPMRLQCRDNRCNDSRDCRVESPAAPDGPISPSIAAWRSWKRGPSPDQTDFVRTPRDSRRWMPDRPGPEPITSRVPAWRGWKRGLHRTRPIS